MFYRFLEYPDNVSEQKADRDIAARLPAMRLAKRLDRARVAELVQQILMPAIKIDGTLDPEVMQPAAFSLMERLVMAGLGKITMSRNELTAARIALPYLLGVPKQELEMTSGGAHAIYAMIAEARREFRAPTQEVSKRVIDALPADLAERARAAQEPDKPAGGSAAQNGVH